MNRYRKYIDAFRKIQGVKVSLNLQAGVTRGEVPNFEATAERDQSRRVRRANNQTDDQRQRLQVQKRQLDLN